MHSRPVDPARCLIPPPPTVLEVPLSKLLYLAETYTQRWAARALASLLGANWELETGDKKQCQMCPLFIMIYYCFSFSSNSRQPGRQEAVWRPSLQLQQAGQTSDQRQWCCHGQVQAQAVPADWRGENYLDLILVLRKRNFYYFRTSVSRWWRPTCG